MANTKRFQVKHGLRTKDIEFTDNSGATNEIVASFIDATDTLSFSGNSGQLFAITDSITGSIFTVNDISGMPSIEVKDTGDIILAETAGNVGIGTDSPSALLDVNDTGATDNAWNTLAKFRPDLSDQNAETSIHIQSYPSTTVVADRRAGIQSIDDVGNARDLVLNKDGGNVGIGISDPTNILTVLGTGNAAYTNSKGIVLDYQSTSVTDIIPIGFSWSNSIGNQNPYWGMSFIPTNFASGTGELGFVTGGTERMRLDSAGRLGIALNDPRTPAHIRAVGNGASPTDVLTIETYRADVSTFTGGSIVFRNSDTNSAGQARIKVGSSNSTDIGFNDEDSQSFIFETGIAQGTSTSSISVDVDNIITVDHVAFTTDLNVNDKVAIAAGGFQGSWTVENVVSNVQFTAKSSTGADYTAVATDTTARTLTTTSPVDRMIIRADGSVGIGDIAPNSKFVVVSGNKDASLGTLDNGNVMSLQSESGNTSMKLNMGVDSAQNVAFIQSVKPGTSTQPLVFNPAGGNVGIGTVSPADVLEISKQLSAVSTVDFPLVVSSRDDANSINQLGGEGVGIKFRLAGNNTTTPGNSFVGAGIAAIRESEIDTTSTTSLAFYTSQNDETLDRYMTIRSSGNVGIGTDSPERKLHSVADQDIAIRAERTTTDIEALQGVLELKSTSSGDMVDGFGNYISYAIEDGAGVNNLIGYHGYRRSGAADNSGDFFLYTYNGGVGNEALVIDRLGNVGIGTVDGDVTSDGNASRTYVGIIGTANRGRLNIGTTASDGADAGTLAFTNGANVLADIVVDTTAGVQNTGNLNINSTDYIRFTANGNEVRIDSSGNVGIGTDSPGEKLVIYENDSSFPNTTLLIHNDKADDAAVLILRGERTAADFDAGQVVFNNSTKAIAVIMGVTDTATDNGSLQFWTASSGSNAVSRAVIDSDGNFGVGTTNPTNKFEVAGTQGQLFSVADSFTGTIFSVNDGSGVPSVEVLDTGDIFLAEFGGRVGIGTSAPARPLEVSFASETFGLRLTRNDAAGNSLIEFANTSGVQTYIGHNAGLNAFVVNNDGVDRMVVLDNGNVGIGTNTPDGKLHIENTSGTSTEMYIAQQKTYGVGAGTAERAKLILSISETGFTASARPFAEFSARSTDENTSIDGALDIGVRSGGAITNVLTLDYNQAATFAGNISSGAITTSGNVTVNKVDPVIILNDSDATSNTDLAAYISFQRSNTEQGWVGFGSSNNSDVTLMSADDVVLRSGGNNTLRVSGVTTTALGKVATTKAQHNNGASTNAHFRALPSDITDTTGLTSLFLGTSTVDGYGVSLNGARKGADGTPTFTLRTHNNSVNGSEVFTIDHTGVTSFVNSVNATQFIGTSSATGVDGSLVEPFRLSADDNSWMMKVAGFGAADGWGLFWAGNGTDSGDVPAYGTVQSVGDIWGNASNQNEFCFVGNGQATWVTQGFTGQVYQKGDLWLGSSGNAPTIYRGGQEFLAIQDAAPTGVDGNLWWESDTGKLKIYYNDGNTSQWVDAVPIPDTSTLYSKAGGTITGAVNINSSLTTTGNAFIGGDVYANYSDSRLKNFTGTIENSLDKVKSLSGYLFTENEVAKQHGFDNDDQQVGVSAQEVQAVLPEAVALAPFDRDAETGVSKSGEDYLTVQYEKLVPLLIEAIKEQSATIETLTKRLEKLEG